MVKIVTAYSAVQDGTRRRVQDAVRCHADEILELTAAGGNTYVCGGAGIVAPALRGAFAEIYQRYAGVSADEGVAWLEEPARDEPLSRGRLGSALTYGYREDASARRKQWQRVR